MKIINKLLEILPPILFISFIGMAEPFVEYIVNLI